MPVLNGRRFSELDRTRVGVAALVTLVLMTVLALNVGTIERSFFEGSFHADFAQASGLIEGDKVQVSGVTVGSVGKIDLDGTHVRVYFHARDIDLGNRSRAAIKTLNAVGTRYLSLTPAGSGHTDGVPLARTSVPYDLNAALSDLTRTSEQIDVKQLASSLDSVSGAFAGTPADLRSAVSGVTRLSQTIASRDDALGTMLKRIDDVSGVLAQRSDQIVQLMSNGTKLLQELNARHETIRALLGDAKAVSRALTGLVADNKKQFLPTLNKVDDVVALLQKNEKALTYVLDHLGSFTRNLGEAVGGGPFFYGYLANIAPTQIIPVLPELVNKNWESGQ